MPKLSWKTIQVPLGSLKEWDKNPAQISERDAKQLAKSLDKFGYIIPFVAAAPKNGKKELPLLDGHQRKMVELQLRHTDPKTLVDVRVPNRALTEKEKQEAVIRMRSNTGEYNPDALLNWFDGGDLLDWGMEQKELESFGFEFEDTSQDAELQIDRAAELLKKWKVKTGDLWQIGEHRLICGDCTDAAVVARVMGNDKAKMIWSDPPFGISYNGHGESVDGRANKFDPIQNDDTILDGWLDLVPTDVIYLKTTWKTLSEWENLLSSYGRIKSRIVWDKCSHVAGDVLGGYATQSEIILYCVVSGKSNINKFDTDVWRIERATTGSPEQRTGHPFESPVSLPSRAIENSTDENDMIYDPFCGSGTALVACENLSRRCRAVELEPVWTAVALQRMSDAFPGIEIKRLK